MYRKPMDKFVTLYSDLHKRLKTVVRRYVDNPVDVEDVVQEAYLRSLEKERELGIQNPDAYVTVAARNLALNYLRSSRSKVSVPYTDEALLDVGEFAPSAEATLDADRRFRLYCQAVETLPTQCRKVFTLRHVYGFTQKEIASYLKITEKTVEYHVGVGLARVRLYMLSHCGEQENKAAESAEGNKRV